MTYYFSGVIGIDRSLDWDWLMDHLGGVQLHVDVPFTGCVHALGADYRMHDPEEWEREIILEFSRKSGDSPLIGLVVECFGGICGQVAVLFRGGERVQVFESDGSARSALEQALEAAGHPVSSGDMPFLERGVFKFDDRANMRRAFALARRNLGKTGENPSVGCVLIDGHEVIAQAVTSVGGRPHAEEQALLFAGEFAEGCTAYVTLEPCRERSSDTPSCSTRLISAGVARVVYAADDPHPNGSGGADRLRAAGIDVVKLDMPEQVTALYGDWMGSSPPPHGRGGGAGR